MRAHGWRRGCSRRTFVKLMAAGAAGLCLRPARANPAADTGPIARSLGESLPGVFSGDDPRRAHRILWDKPAWLAAHGGRYPAPAERVPLAVVGGGLGGLTAAYLLRRHRPVVFEQAPRFGGNARGESWRGMDYAIGAAYFTAPEAGSPLAALYAELGVDRLWRRKPEGHPAALGGRLVADFWQGETAPAGARRQFHALAAYFRRIWNEEEGLRYPQIPAATAQQRALVDALDRTSFRRHVVARLGGRRLHPHIATAFEHYCWSSFGASFGEVGAAAGLNFFAAEFGDILVTPGGNAAIAERLHTRLGRELPPGHLRAGALVANVRAVPGGFEVAWEDADGILRCLHARAVVMACPKFVAARLVEDFEPARREAIGRLRYRSYLVANVLLERRLAEAPYDLYLLGDGTSPGRDVRAAAARQGATDVVFGQFVHPDAASSVLTLYRPLPYDGARPALLEETAHARVRREFEAQLFERILPLLGLGRAEVAGIRLARWGHALPVAATGLIAGGTVDRLRRPFRDGMFFVQQDNWALPALETAVSEAFHWAPHVHRHLAG
jgi:phytoene dehydrogenase-like protein